VGFSSSSRDPEHAFLYSGGKMIDLNSLIDSTSGWTLKTAQGINDNGQIVGEGIHNGYIRAFLLTPTSMGTGTGALKISR